ncbi:unnamed protein product, partial [Ectocarpus fasciculatus]
MTNSGRNRGARDARVHRYGVTKKRTGSVPLGTEKTPARSATAQSVPTSTAARSRFSLWRLLFPYSVTKRVLGGNTARSSETDSGAGTVRGVQLSPPRSVKYRNGAPGGEGQPSHVDQEAAEAAAVDGIGGGGGGGGGGWKGGVEDRDTGSRRGHGSKASYSGSGGSSTGARAGSARRAPPAIRCTASSQSKVRRGLGMEQYTDPWNDFPPKVDAMAAGGGDDFGFEMSNEPWSAYRTFFAAAARVRAARRSAQTASRRHDMSSIGCDSQGAGSSQPSAETLSLGPVLGVGRRNNGHERLERGFKDSPPSPATSSMVPAHASEYRSGSDDHQNVGGTGIYKGHVSDGGTEGDLEKKATPQAEASSQAAPEEVSTSYKSFGRIHYRSTHAARRDEDGECFLDGECGSHGGSSLSTRAPTMLGPVHNITAGFCHGRCVSSYSYSRDVSISYQSTDRGLTDREWHVPSTTGKPSCSFKNTVSEEGYHGDGDSDGSTDGELSWPSTPGNENDGGSESFRGIISDGGTGAAFEASTAGVETFAPALPASSISCQSIGGIHQQSSHPVRRAGNGKRYLDEEDGSYGSGGPSPR